jgi:hypothetical protein
MEEIKNLTDEQVEKEFTTLKEKKDATKEDNDKLAALKDERTNRYQKRLDKIQNEKLLEKQRADKLEADMKAQKQELDSLKNERHQQAKPIIVEEYVEYDGKKYYTDKSLISMVESKELDPQQAYQHQQQRLKAEIKDEIERDQKSKQAANENQKIWEEDKNRVLSEYPEFNPSHPKHNPEDPLYKLASEIYREDFLVNGIAVNPKALSLSIKRAKQILKINETRPDVTHEHSVTRQGSASSSSHEPTTISQIERDTAVRMYASVINPATNKFYTEQEAINKALKAKEARKR